MKNTVIVVTTVILVVLALPVALARMVWEMAGDLVTVYRDW